jgi:hypothetical protein
VYRRIFGLSRWKSVKVFVAELRRLSLETFQLLAYSLFCEVLDDGFLWAVKPWHL